MDRLNIKAGASRNFNCDPNDRFIMSRIEVMVLENVKDKNLPKGYHSQLHKKLLLLLANLVTETQVRRGYQFNPPPISIPVSFKTNDIIRFIVTVEQNYHASATDKYVMEKYIGGDEITLTDDDTFDGRFKLIFDSLMLEMQNGIADAQRERGILPAIPPPPGPEEDESL